MNQRQNNFTNPINSTQNNEPSIYQLIHQSINQIQNSQQQENINQINNNKILNNKLLNLLKNKAHSNKKTTNNRKLKLLIHKAFKYSKITLVSTIISFVGLLVGLIVIDYVITQIKAPEYTYNKNYKLNLSYINSITRTYNPIPTSNFDKTDDYSANAIAVLDLDSNYVVYEKRSQNKLAIASLTKLITTKVIYDNTTNPNQIVTISEEAYKQKGSYLELQINDKLTQKDAIKAALIASNNQVLYALQNANLTVAQANKYIKALNLANTNVSNPAGFDNKDNYSSAADLLVIAKVFFENPDLLDITSMKQTDITEIGSNKKISIINTNDFKKLNYDFVLAGKTGTTQQAGQNLCILVTKNNRRYIIVILGSRERYQDAIKIINRL